MRSIAIQPIFFFALVGLGLWFLWMAFRAWRVRRYLRTVPLPYSPEWDTFDALAIPTNLQKADERLREMGFTPLGVERSVYRPVNLNQTAWVYRNDDGSIYASVEDSNQTKRPVNAAFVTWFPDDTLIVTAFPQGFTIQERDLHYRFAAYSLQAAFSYHTYMLERWRAEHGDPVLITDTADIDRTDAIHTRKYRQRIYRQVIRDQTIYIIAYGAIGMISLALMPLYLVDYNMIMRIPILSRLQGIGALFPLASFGVLFYRIWSSQRYRDTSFAVDAEFKQELTPNRRERGQHPLEADPIEVDI